ncbi:putative transcription factor interactor and regulator CCHC(Zn) family [Helianthus anomalus]
MTKVKCYNCCICGHSARECQKPKSRERSNGSSARSNNNSPAPSNTTSTTSTTTSSDNLTPNANSSMIVQPLQTVYEPHDWGNVMEETTIAIVSQAFIAEIIEEGFGDLFEEANVEELTVVAEALSENLEMEKIIEVEENERKEN